MSTSNLDNVEAGVDHSENVPAREKAGLEVGGNLPNLADYQTVFTNAKAGMEGVDKEYVKRVVYEMSKDSAHFKNEQRKQAAVDEKIKRMKDQAASLSPSVLAAKTLEMDRKLSSLEAGRDLSRTWIHVDMDAFFASCEELANPALKDVPMAVGGIGMISTANYKARKFGVRSAMPGFIAKKLCPHLVFVKSNFARYTSASEQTRKVFSRYDPHFESGSLDEAYLDVTDYCQVHDMTGAQVAECIRTSVASETGLTCSCGVAPNKVLAKVCSDINKPNGQYVLPNDRFQVAAFVETLPVRKVPGVGKVSEQMLSSLGIKVCKDLATHRGLLAALFQPASLNFFMEAALGLGCTRHVERDSSPGHVSRKGISCERTFRAITDKHELEQMAGDLVRHLVDDMAKEHIEGNNITLKIKGTDFKVTTHAKTLRQHVHAVQDILPHVITLLQAQMPCELRLMGVRMSGLRRRGAKVAPTGALARFLRPIPNQNSREPDQSDNHQQDGDRQRVDFSSLPKLVARPNCDLAASSGVHQSQLQLPANGALCHQSVAGDKHGQPLQAGNSMTAQQGNKAQHQHHVHTDGPHGQADDVHHQQREPQFQQASPSSGTADPAPLPGDMCRYAPWDVGDDTSRPQDQMIQTNRHTLADTYGHSMDSWLYEGTDEGDHDFDDLGHEEDIDWAAHEDSPLKQRTSSGPQVGNTNMTGSLVNSFPGFHTSGTPQLSPDGLQIGATSSTNMNVHAQANASSVSRQAHAAHVEVKVSRTVSSEGPSVLGSSNDTKLETASSSRKRWTCRVCTYADNRLHLLRCEVCDCLKGQGTAQVPPRSHNPQHQAKGNTSKASTSKQRGMDGAGSILNVVQKRSVADSGGEKRSQSISVGGARQEVVGAHIDQHRRCVECGQMVSASDWQEHVDIHEAMKLSLRA